MSEKVVIHAGGMFPPSFEKVFRTRCGRKMPFEQMAFLGGPRLTCKACKAVLNSKGHLKRWGMNATEARA